MFKENFLLFEVGGAEAQSEGAEVIKESSDAASDGSKEAKKEIHDRVF